MGIFAVLALAFAPGIFWLWYFYRKDKLEPEPKLLFVRTFFLGMLAALFVVLLEVPFSGLLLIVIAAPIIEEYAKYFVVRRTIYKNVEFDEPMDGMVYAAAAALGFASAENAGYLIDAYLSPQEALVSSEPVSAFGTVWTVFVLRALLSVPGHVLFSSMWGYALGWAKFKEAERGRRLIRSGLLLAIALHGLFNFLLVIVPLGALGMVIFVILAWRTVNRKIAHALAGSPHVFESSGASPIMGKRGKINKKE
ncbi:MAG: PrsW family intramembrane metalloprotease [Proteobacteria bacterium]|nr:PrsW family intramembrane metalloprotease [Pseudomonadota bacterium]